MIINLLTSVKLDMIRNVKRACQSFCTIAFIVIVSVSGSMTDRVRPVYKSPGPVPGMRKGLGVDISEHGLFFLIIRIRGQEDNKTLDWFGQSRLTT